VAPGRRLALVALAIQSDLVAPAALVAPAHLCCRLAALVAPGRLVRQLTLARLAARDFQLPRHD
jgi:hypothetical protein